MYKSDIQFHLTEKEWRKNKVVEGFFYVDIFLFAGWMIGWKYWHLMEVLTFAESIDIWWNYWHLNDQKFQFAR